MVRRAAIALLLLSLTSCTEAGPFSDIPHPYRPSGKGAFDTSKLVMADHIVVSEISGLDKKVSDPLRKAIAEALGDNDVLATTEAPPMRTSELKGTYNPEPAPHVSWTLVDPYGMTRGSFETDLPLQALIYPETETEARKSTAYLVAIHLSGGRPAARPNLQATLPMETGAPNSAQPALYGDLPSLYFLPILGAPGDGNAALAKAMTSALASRGIKVLAQPDPKDLQLQCFVSVRPEDGGQSTIQLFWEVKSPDGKSIASVDQANRIGTGSLDGPWGPLATDIAEAAADGIAQFLSQTAP